MEQQEPLVLQAQQERMVQQELTVPQEQQALQEPLVPQVQLEQMVQQDQ
jgi:hypothetical protein